MTNCHTGYSCELGKWRIVILVTAMTTWTGYTGDSCELGT